MNLTEQTEASYAVITEDRGSTASAFEGDNHFHMAHKPLKLAVRRAVRNQNRKLFTSIGNYEDKAS